MTNHYLDATDAVELVSIIEFFAGWLNADAEYARHRLLLYGNYTVDDLRADTARILKALKAQNGA